MGLNKRVGKRVVALGIMGACAFAGGKFASQLDVYNPYYWQQEMTAEKSMRAYLLENVRGLGADGAYSADDLAALYSGIFVSTSAFDSSSGLFSPRKTIMAGLNHRYETTFSENRAILHDLMATYTEMAETGGSLMLEESDLDERVNKTIAALTAEYSNSTSQDVRFVRGTTQGTRYFLGGLAGGVLGLVVYLSSTYLITRRMPGRRAEQGKL
jgi:hypothetical protein